MVPVPLREPRRDDDDQGDGSAATTTAAMMSVTSSLVPVVRYGKEHKEATRRRIIETAGRRLKRDGIDGSGVATLMADAGLTNGAFYAHFASKEDLVATAVSEQLRGQREWLAAFSPRRDGGEQKVRPYLSPQPPDNPEEGCPSAPLPDQNGPRT